MVASPEMLLAMAPATLGLHHLGGGCGRHDDTLGAAGMTDVARPTFDLQDAGVHP